MGAGVGGLTAAAKLVNEGLHVLVLEKNPHPGGTAYVYKRKGFTFPMGWSWDYEDFHDCRPRELVGTPIKGLYMAGYQAFSALFMGGVPTAMESGSRAAEAILRKTGPIEEVMIPGVERREKGDVPFVQKLLVK